jgi:hypothetical protein
VKIPCINCERLLDFSIKNDIVTGSEGIIAINFQGAVCPDCVHSILDRVADPPGLICVNELP